MKHALAVFVAVLLGLISSPLGAQVSFFHPPLYSGSGTVFVADFNADGKPDILTSDGTMNLGNGDGTFTPGTSLSKTSVPILAVADFNGDGKPDVLEYTTGTLLVLLGNGDGTFQAPISTASNAGLTVFAATDLNGDGKADVVGIWNSSLYVYISNGDGTFKSGVQYNVGAVGAANILIGDFNGDGKTDVAINVSAAEVVFLGNGDGTFQTTPKTSSGVAGVYFVTGDFNGDGKLDIAVSSSTFLSSAYVLLGNGDGTFHAPAAVFSGPGTLAVGDVNDDGKLDLILSTNPSTVEIYLGNGDASFGGPSSYGVTLSPGSSGIALADFNGDGKLDIAAGGVLLGNGDGTFRGIPLGVIPDFPPTAATVGDFEKKGALDVAVLSSNGGQLYILSNNGSGTLSLIHAYPLQQLDTAVVTADFNGDGNPDLAFIGTDTTTGNWSYSVMLGNGDGSFQSPVIYIQTGAAPNSFVVADFNNDHKPDLAFAFGTTANSFSDSVTILLGKGDGTFAPPVYYYDAGGGPMLVADFNGDGNLDIALGIELYPQDSYETGILYGNGDGTFQGMVLPASLNFFFPYLAGDFNNDGKSDLLGFVVALANSDGTFTVLPSTLGPGVGGGVGETVTADFNGDGRLDLLGTIVPAFPHGISPGSGITLGNGDGTFGPVITVTSPGGIVSPVFAVDMNGDGLPDIVFPWEDNVDAVPATTTGIAVLINTTKVGPPQPDFQMLASGLSSTPVIAGNSATSTVTVSPLNGFTGTVALSCTGLPSGISCSFNPTSIVGGSSTSALTIGTASGLPTGTYTIIVSGLSGSISHTVPLRLTLNSTSSTPDFQISATSASPATVAPGNSATSTLTVAALDGFNSAVALTCASAVSGVTCSLYPASVTPSLSTNPTSILTISTASGTASGAYSMTVFATSGSTVHTIGVPLIVQITPDFTINPASGSPTSQTIRAGQTASFTLSFAGTGSFSGTVNLACAITPVVNPAPTCDLSGSSVQISGGSPQTAAVNVMTTAPLTTSVGPSFVWPGGPMWSISIVSALSCLLARGRRRLSTFATPILLSVVALSLSCGGSSSNHTTPGTPPGPYTATVTATSGSLSHNVALQVIVQ